MAHGMSICFRSSPVSRNGCRPGEGSLGRPVPAPAPAPACCRFSLQRWRGAGFGPATYVILASDGTHEASKRIHDDGDLLREQSIRGDSRLRLVVVGAGAAGMYGAIRAKDLCPSMDVIVFEKGQPLAKVKVSGGGRCNVTTGLYVDPLPLARQYPRGHKELRGSFFQMHSPLDTARWFQQRGVALKTEADGRMFPVSDSSSSIVGCLLHEARKVGVSLQTATPVRKVMSAQGGGGGFKVVLGKPNAGIEEEHMHARYLLLATGSDRHGFAMARSLGHGIVEPLPSLFSFKVSDASLAALAGVSFTHVRASLTLSGCTRRDPNLTQEGPLLVTHSGVSGPVILRLSAWAARLLHSCSYQGKLDVDLIPWLETEAALDTLVRHKETALRRKLGSSPPLAWNLPRRFWLYLLSRLTTKSVSAEASWGSLSVPALRDITGVAKRLDFHVAGKAEFKDEFVTAGGVPLREVHMRTLESKLCPGLFFAGEILDVDGVTGGFNFQNAWTGGFIAGSTVAEHGLRNSAVCSTPLI